MGKAPNGCAWKIEEGGVLRKGWYTGKEVAPAWKMKVGHAGVRVSATETLGRVIYAVQGIQRWRITPTRGFPNSEDARVVCQLKVQSRP
jgi:hypothetical protein